MRAGAGRRDAPALDIEPSDSEAMQRRSTDADEDDEEACRSGERGRGQRDASKPGRGRESRTEALAKRRHTRAKDIFVECKASVCASVGIAPASDS